MSDQAPKYGCFHGTNIPRKRPPAEYEGRGQCKKCGAPGLIWEQHADGWRLVDMGGKRHVCRKGQA